MSDKKNDQATEATAVDTVTTAPAVDEVLAKLGSLGVPEEKGVKIKNDLGVETAADLALVTEQDLVGIGWSPIAARKLAAALQPPVPEAVAAQTADAVIASILPQVPDYASLLDQLRTGGVLKVERSTVTGWVQAWVANRAGLFGITERLAAEIKAYAERNDEPVDPKVYYRLKNQLTRTRYGDLFAGKAPVVQPHKAGGRTFYRLRIAGFESRDEARKFCAALIAAGNDCIPAAAL